MNEKSVGAGKTKANGHGILLSATLVACVLLVIAVSGCFFARYLREQIFIERTTQLNEITAQVRINLTNALDAHWNMVSAYGGFVLMSLHLGLHWGMMMGMARRIVKKVPDATKWLLRGIAALMAGYGIYAFIRREIGLYLFLQNQYVFFDFEEPLIFFLADYMAVMALFVWLGHYFSKGLRYIIQKKKSA